jgi:hypothetical protein
MKQAAADRGAVDPFRGEAEIMRHRHRRLAGGRDADPHREDQQNAKSATIFANLLTGIWELALNYL